MSILRSDFFLIFILLPLVAYIRVYASDYKSCFGLFSFSSSKIRDALNLLLILVLFLVYLFCIQLNFNQINGTLFIALIYLVHILYLSIEVFDSRKGKNLNLNFAIILFISVLDKNSLQLKILFGFMSLIILLNKDQKPIKLVEFIFLAYEALFLSVILGKWFENPSKLVEYSLIIGLFAIILMCSQLKWNEKILSNLAKLSSTVFILYLLFLSAKSQWSYWF